MELMVYQARTVSTGKMALTEQWAPPVRRVPKGLKVSEEKRAPSVSETAVQLLFNSPVSRHCRTTGTCRLVL